MRISKRFLMIASMCYLYLPIEIFVCTWTKWYIALPATLVFGYAFLRFLTRSLDGEALELHPAVFAFIVIFLLYIGYLAGWGNFVNQTGDWFKHNTILSDLVDFSWPVYYSNSGDHSMLTYYLAMYMVPAFFGKIFGHSFAVAQFVNGVWAYLGLLLIALNLLRVLHCRKAKSQILATLMLILYAGPLVLGQYILMFLYPGVVTKCYMGNTMWFAWSKDVALQYTSNFNLLQWVHPQAIGTWLILLIFLEHRKQIEDYCFILLPGIFFATMAFIGLMPFVLVEAIVLLAEMRSLKGWFRNIFKIENILTFAFYLLIFGSYFWGNVTGDKPGKVGFAWVDYTGYEPTYFIFIFLMVLIYAMCLFVSNRKNTLYYTATITLLFLPLVKMGLFNDLCMRASIPALFVYMMLVIQFLVEQFDLNDDRKEGGAAAIPMNQKVAAIVLAETLCFGAIYPIDDIVSAIKTDELFEMGEEYTYYTMGIFANRDLDLYIYTMINVDLLYNYYTYDIEDQFFYKYIASEQREFE